jgi:hypothetical protein
MMLRLIVANAVESVQAGEASVEQAILHAAVHGWCGGHVEGEDSCPGCEYRGKLEKSAVRG